MCFLSLEPGGSTKGNTPNSVKVKLHKSPQQSGGITNIYLLERKLMIKKYFFAKQFIAILSAVFFMVGCTKKGISIEDMEREIKEFHLPQQPQPGKALVYAIYDDILPGIFPQKLDISYIPSTAEKFEEDSDKPGIVRLVSGIAEDLSSLVVYSKEAKPLNLKNIGSLSTKNYKAIQMEPGYYEFNIKSPAPNKCIKDEGIAKYIKLETGKIYFFTIEGSFFINQYAGGPVFFLSVRMITDLIEGKYKLSKNFKESL